MIQTSGRAHRTHRTALCGHGIRPLALLTFALTLLTLACRTNQTWALDTLSSPSENSKSDGSPLSGSESSNDKQPLEEQKAGTAKSATKKRTLPWEFDKKYVYSWVLGGVHVADTEFTIETIGKPSAPEKKPGKAGQENQGYRIHSKLRYESEAQTRDLTRHYVFDKNWNLQTVDSTDELRFVNSRQSNKTERIWKEGSVLVTEIQQNNDEPTRSEIILPGSAYVLPQDGVVVWGLIMPLELPIDKSTRVRIGYPPFAALYDVKIRNRGSREIELRSGQTVDTLRYSFESKNRVLHGDLWVDSRGRVVRFRQGKLFIDLKSDPKPAKRQKPTKK